VRRHRQLGLAEAGLVSAPFQRQKKRAWIGLHFEGVKAEWKVRPLCIQISRVDMAAFRSAADEADSGRWPWRTFDGRVTFFSHRKQNTDMVVGSVPTPTGFHIMFQQLGGGRGDSPAGSWGVV